MSQQISIGTAKSEIVVLPNDTNHYGTIFGGALLSYMDRTAFIAAKKYAQNDLVLVSLQNVAFKAPVKLGEAAEISAFVFSVGKTSVDVCVNVSSNNNTVVENAHFTYVNVDAKGKAIPVIQPAFANAEEKTFYEKRLAEQKSDVNKLF